MTNMTPPDQHIALIENLVRESLVGEIGRGNIDLQSRNSAKLSSEMISKEIVVSLTLFRLLLVPNHHSDRACLFLSERSAWQRSHSKQTAKQEQERESLWREGEVSLHARAFLGEGNRWERNQSAEARS